MPAEVGSALVRRLAREPVEIVTADRSALDLARQADVEAWMQRGSGRRWSSLPRRQVGGILANATRPVEFLEENLLIELNLIRTAYSIGVEKLLFLGFHLASIPEGLPAADPRGFPAQRPS